MVFLMAKKINEFILFCARFSVTLDEFAGFLCIKAMRRIEKFLGYDLETVLNSMFCYELLKRTPDDEQPSRFCSPLSCAKVQQNSEIVKAFACLNS